MSSLKSIFVPGKEKLWQLDYNYINLEAIQKLRSLLKRDWEANKDQEEAEESKIELNIEDIQWHLVECQEC